MEQAVNSVYFVFNDFSFIKHGFIYLSYTDLMKLQHLKPTVNIRMYPVMLDKINSEVYQRI